ncbi:McrB family protein [Streptomyces sp. NRRL F-5727]|uniref:McrB family protein n=1 Tax=Streptomyces sp. NRRL F-5727 TaxID=1463871 RepID=UPI0004CBFE4B|nr:AAA family ATPase [Streptomyces sp. NRRL F-5727]
MADGERRYAVTIDGRAYELSPSPGEVILPAHGFKIHHSPGCGHLTDSDSLPRHPDPDGLLWRRLLDAEDPAAFATSSGLLNGRNRPVVGVCSCALRPVTDSHAETLPYWPVDDALRVFDAERHRAAVEAADRDAERIRTEFPWEDWAELPLERYALGQPDRPGHQVYSYLLEFGSKALGSITGGTAKKHFVYRQNHGTWWFDKRYADVDEAWRQVRAGLVAAVTAAREGRVRDIDDITSVRSGIMVVAKTLRIYAPDSVLPVYSDSFTQHCLNRLAPGTATAKLQPFARKELLKSLVDEDPRFAGWPPQLVWRFLDWWAPARRTSARIVRIGVPGLPAEWEPFFTEGFVPVAADRVGDLHWYADEDEFTAAFDEAYADAGPSGTRPTARAAELWSLLDLRDGDRVLATRGRSEVLGVGRVHGDGYLWIPSSEAGPSGHAVQVLWDEGRAGRLAEPVADWGDRLVSDVPAALWNKILSRLLDVRAAGATAGAEPGGLVEIPPLDAALQRIDDALERRGQAVLFGPPGTGKTYHALRYAVRRLGELSADLPGVDPLAEPGTAAFAATIEALTEAGRLTMATFHPSYGYEDFVEGLRPVKGASGFVLEPVDGVFKRVCATAAADPGQLHLLVVDELNRGNLPSILGESITVLEKDKRGLPVTLPLSGAPFRVPPNVRLLGTMNTADRSIRMLDSAIRRRFAFIELLPDPGPLRGSQVDQLDLGVFLDRLNARIRTRLDREKQIGHAFFLAGGVPVATAAEFAAIVRGEILPLLQEYAYDDYGLLAGFLGEELVDVAAHTLRDLTDEDLVNRLYEELQVGSGGE